MVQNLEHIYVCFLDSTTKLNVQIRGVKKNTRTDVIKQNVLYLEVTDLGPLQSTLLPNACTYPNGVSTC